MQKCRNAEMQKCINECRNAEMQKCRNAEMYKCAGQCFCFPIFLYLLPTTKKKSKCTNTCSIHLLWGLKTTMCCIKLVGACLWIKVIQWRDVLHDRSCAETHKHFIHSNLHSTMQYGPVQSGGRLELSRTSVERVSFGPPQLVRPIEGHLMSWVEVGEDQCLELDPHTDIDEQWRSGQRYVAGWAAVVSIGGHDNCGCMRSLYPVFGHDRLATNLDICIYICIYSNI